MDALNNLAPETKISDLTVEQFEAVMTRTLCRVADFAAVRFAQEQRGTAYASDQEQQEFVNDRAEGTKQVREMIAGEEWPRFPVLSYTRTMKD